ncbi:hypothetical protein CCACVL1_25715 [Corchorus capsularis]|uniref:Uncharacterized protein n=1 Tax=Corchorus capsularis TaxID=210143 RepID=A0A1R3GHY8_COCAP|nr:hypothetical protein CCACVL1_25715 [Corchorus capsularis]
MEELTLGYNLISKINFIWPPSGPIVATISPLFSKP